MLSRLQVDPIEKKIFDLSLQALKLHEIADKVNRSAHTVCAIRSRLFKRLGVDSVRHFLFKYCKKDENAVPQTYELVGFTPQLVEDLLSVYYLKDCVAISEGASQL